MLHGLSLCQDLHDAPNETEVGVPAEAEAEAETPMWRAGVAVGDARVGKL